jgi:hypothetical protein
MWWGPMEVGSCSLAQKPRGSLLWKELIPLVLFFAIRDAQNQMILGACPEIQPSISEDSRIAAE